MTHDEMVHRFGEDIVNNEKLINHDSEDAENMVEIGTLPSGGKCVINRLAVETELLISEGLINPHFLRASRAAANPCYLALLPR